MSLAGFQSFDFAHEGRSKCVYRRGSGPGVVLMHELPGLTPECVELANHIADAGFTVFMPLLFGDAGAPFSAHTLAEVTRACIRREFHLFAKGHASPITTWLRALCRLVHEEIGGVGVGAIGMCLTGNFALALMVDEEVMAPVLSQPSLPFSVLPSHKRALHISDEDLAIVRRRARAGTKVLGLRFTGDFMCPRERFDRLREELGDAFEAIEIDSSKGNPYGNPRSAHAVLTHHLVDEDGHPTAAARDRVLSFLREQLTRS